MKTDKFVSNHPLTRDELFFVECWFNKVHEHSLDSYRVRALNVRNAVRELERVYFGPGNTDDRREVRKEAAQLLADDPVLRTEPFAAAHAQLVDLLSGGGPLDKAKEDGPSRLMLRYFLAEMSRLIEDHYVVSSLACLTAVLLEGQMANSSEQDRFDHIEKVTGHLLSVLLDRKASLESLYMLYKEILVPRPRRRQEAERGYVFARKWGLLKRLLTQPERAHTIVFALDNVTSPQDFPTEIGGVSFSHQSPVEPVEGDRSRQAEASRKYFAPANKRLFATQIVSAQDPRAAGASAAQRLNNILNLVRFEYERARVSMPDSFAFVVDKKPPRVFSVPMVVPNPSSAMDSIELAAFVKSVDELVTSAPFAADGRDRVYSAFRLYRTGLDM